MMTAVEAVFKINLDECQCHSRFFQIYLLLLEFLSFDFDLDFLFPVENVVLGRTSGDASVGCSGVELTLGVAGSGGSRTGALRSATFCAICAICTAHLAHSFLVEGFNFWLRDGGGLTVG